MNEPFEDDPPLAETTDPREFAKLLLAFVLIGALGVAAFLFIPDWLVDRVNP